MLLSNMVPIKYPDITKNISTPTNPPGISVGNAWKITTEITASARRPSISLLYFKLGFVIGFRLKLLLAERQGAEGRDSAIIPLRKKLPSTYRNGQQIENSRGVAILTAKGEATEHQRFWANFSGNGAKKEAIDKASTPL